MTQEQAPNTLVVIDDDPDVLRATARILEQAHYKVITGVNAAQALELTRLHKPALLLLDVVLPDGNGVDVARQLKSETALAGVFVILMSGLKTLGDDQAVGLATGLADGYIARPFSKPEFLARIDAMLRLRSAQEALRESLSRMQKIANRVPGVVYQYRLRPDGSSCFPYASEAIRAIYRVSPEQVLDDASSVFSVLHPSDIDAVVTSIQASARDLAPWRQEYRVKFEDGSVRWLFGDALPEREHDGGTLWHGFITDITERKQAEQELIAARIQAEHASRAKSEFLTSMSHELRTPLNAVLGFAQVLAADASLSSDQHASAQDIVDGGGVLLRLIGDVLDLSSIESGRITMDLQRVVVHPIALKSIRMVEAAAQAGALTLRLSTGDASGAGSTDAADVAGATIVADPVRLQQVLLNLLSNAIKYNRPGGRVDVSCSLHLGQLRIVVSDTGVGIAAPDQARLFTAFDRLAYAGSAIPGTGIGLVITKRCVQAMGGSLGFSSVLGQGSTFWVEFALAPAQAHSAVVLAAEDAEPERLGQAPTEGLQRPPMHAALPEGASLREQAEVQIGKVSAQRPTPAVETMTCEASAVLVHELQVHQIELEMQNETLRDTTRELDTARAHLSDLYDQAPLAYLSVDALGRVQRSNLAAATLLGTTRSALQQQHLSRFIHSTHQDAYFLLCRQMALENAPQQERELLMLRPDGTPFWAKLVASVLKAADADADAGVQYVVVDIDAYKRAQAIERQALTRHRSVLQTALDGFWQADTQGRLVEVNAAYCAMSGYSEQELLAMQISDLEAVESTADTAARIHKILTQGSDRFESRQRRKDGTVFDVGLSVQYRSDEGGRFVVFVQDITERKKTQAALQDALKVKESLLNEVHHRVKNNLQVISSLLRLENQRIDHAQTRDVLDEMQGRIRSMALLHESLYRSGDFASVDLGGYVKAIARTAFRASARSDGTVRLQVNIQALQVSMDQAIPGGLLVNELVSNCLKHGFADGRSGEVIIDLEPGMQEQCWCLRVSDNGAGLATDFEQKRKTSLGLQLVGNLATQMGGTLEIDSNQPQGAVFTVVFKLAESALAVPPN